jgi:NADP-dependent 3-hydroxy acid dehydrogenase YdfG
MSPLPIDRFRLDDSLAVVTGASSGIGRHCSMMLAGMGATIVLGARRVDQLQHTVTEITQGGGKAHAFPLDVTDCQ